MFSTPLLSSANATIGEAATISSVSAVTTLAMRSTATRGTTRRGEPSSMTGSRLSAGVFQSESRLMFLISAGTRRQQERRPEQDRGHAPLVARHEAVGERGGLGRTNSSTSAIATAA